MVGGVGDGTIESFHDLIGVSNSSNEGAYRAYSDKDQFGYYVARNGELLVADKTPVLGETFLGKRGDTTLGFKWNLLEGGRLMPAFTVKLNYKVGNGESTDGGQTTSGADDRGYMLTLSKGFDPWFVYFGQGVTMFGKSESWQSDSVFHRFLSLEYQMYSNQALVIQNVIQTSMFPAVGDPESTMEEERDNYNLQASTALLMVGYKLQVYNLLFETGVVQDYSNRGNETDFAIFFEAGLQW
jgi:hypothetical protein